MNQAEVFVMWLAFKYPDVYNKYYGQFLRKLEDERVLNGLK